MSTNPTHPPALVVDDEELYLRALVGDLRRRGFTVTARRDLEQAAQAYRELSKSGSPPLLIVDLIQPGENGGYLGGLDLLRGIRPEPGQPVIALADSEAKWLEQAARSLGAERVVRKPDLRRAIPEHLDREMRDFLLRVAGMQPLMQEQEQMVPGQDNESLLGAGVGIRFIIPRQPIVVRFDYGWGLGGRGNDSFPYLSMGYRF